MSNRQYVTTAIDYANAPPHMGHVMEKILADVVARWFRLRGDEVRFQIGMDEHGIKIQQTAEKQKMTPAELVEKTVPLYRDLYDRLRISADVFIRTTDRKVHWPTVVELWKRLVTAGALEKRTYTGFYCVGCERFLTKRDLVEGKCPLHNRAPEEVKEENWFFRLAREGDWLKELLTKEEGYKIVPEFRAPETMQLIQQGLEDVSFSRPLSSLSWGIPVPGDEGQTMYVWCDALTNYISGIDIFGLSFDSIERAGSGSRPKAENHERPRTFALQECGGVEWWSPKATVTHVIGKDISRFHALIWPAMLKNAGVRTPDRLLIHGFLTSEGQKMSKSIGNVVSPEEVLAHFNGNPDPLRFFLSHEIPVGNDGDFSWKRFDEIYDAKMRNQLGNLLNRVLVLLKKEGATLSPDENEPSSYAQGWWKLYEEEMDAFRVHLALCHVDVLLAYGNGYIDSTKPWTQKGQKKSGDLWHVAELLRHITLMLLPFIPETAQRMAKQLNLPWADKMLEKEFVITKEMKEWGSEKSWKNVGEPEILFPPLEK